MLYRIPSHPQRRRHGHVTQQDDTIRVPHHHDTGHVTHPPPNDTGCVTTTTPDASSATYQDVSHNDDTASRYRPRHPPPTPLFDHHHLPLHDANTSYPPLRTHQTHWHSTNDTSDRPRHLTTPAHHHFFSTTTTTSTPHLSHDETTTLPPGCRRGKRGDTRRDGVRGGEGEGMTRAAKGSGRVGERMLSPTFILLYSIYNCM